MTAKGIIRREMGIRWPTKTRVCAPGSGEDVTAYQKPQDRALLVARQTYGRKPFRNCMCVLPELRKN